MKPITLIFRQLLPATLFCMMQAIQCLQACSAFVLKDDSSIILGKNFDWTFGEGILVKNLRGTSKVAYYTHAGVQASWTSLYGSVTFNQNGKEMPYGGMNEKGLVVEMLWLDVTQYNIDADRDYVNELEWIQYQLDNFYAVNEVLNALDDLKIYPIQGRIHYMVADASGASVIIEYINGKPVITQAEQQVCQAITNYPAALSEKYRHQIDGVAKNTRDDLYRYYLIHQQISAIESGAEVSINMAFNILKSVSITKGTFRTKWSTVYDIKGKTISYFTDKQKKIRKVDISLLDFNDSVGCIDLNQDERHDIEQTLKSLTEPWNFKYVNSSFLHLGLDKLLAVEVSKDQFFPRRSLRSYFADHYFHFQISIPADKEVQTGFLAIMRSESDFSKRKAVTGGYLYGSFGKAGMMAHVYGLKNGRYAMLAFIDTIKNKQLDFDQSGAVLEKYATFSDRKFTGIRQINFSNTSAEFTRANANVEVKWITE